MQDAALAIDGIRRYLEGEPKVKFAYLFGSQAKGTAGPLSDIDIAVYIDPEMEAFRYRLALMETLSTLAKTERIDVVVLNSASPVLKFAVIRDGRVLKEDRSQRIRFEQTAISEYLDTAYLRKVQAAYTRRAFNEGIQ